MRFSRLTLDPVVSAPALTLVAVFVSLLIKPTLLYSIDCNGNKIDDAADLVPQNFGFPSPASYATGKGPAAVIAADFNGDGDIDVGAPNSASNDVSVLLHDGSGAFSAPKNFLVGVQPRAFAAADLDGDSHVDLAVANYGAFPDPSPAVSLLLNSGDGTFAETREVVAHGRQISIVAADFDGDSRPDLALTFLGTSNGATFVAPGISVLLNTGNGTFGAPLDLETGDFPSPLISRAF